MGIIFYWFIGDNICISACNFALMLYYRRRQECLWALATVVQEWSFKPDFASFIVFYKFALLGTEILSEEK